MSIVPASAVPNKTGLPWLILAQLVVTLALLGFAVYVQDDPSTRSLIIGAVIAHWLSESTRLGRQVADQRVANSIGGTDSGTPLLVAVSPSSTGTVVTPQGG